MFRSIDEDRLVIVDLYEHENRCRRINLSRINVAGKKLYTTFDNFEIIPLFFNRSNGIKYIKKILEMVFEFAARRDRKIRRERRSSDNNN